MSKDFSVMPTFQGLGFISVSLPAGVVGLRKRVLDEIRRLFFGEAREKLAPEVCKTLKD
jgi:hypothetical protein